MVFAGTGLAYGHLILIKLVSNNGTVFLSNVKVEKT
jgi:hypothetical protein